MTIAEALDCIIDEGIEACRKDYADDEPKRTGSIEGFEACRGKVPSELAALLDCARAQQQRAFIEASEDRISTEEYWRIQCFCAEIEWTCSVISAILMNNGFPIIVTPTMRGAMQAAKIVGVKGKPEGFDPWKEFQHT